LFIIGPDWIGAVESLAGLVLITLPPRWWIPLFAALVAGITPFTFLWSSPEWALYFTMGMLLTASALAVPVWLLTSVRELRAARAKLADEAVIQERIRIDEELGETLGAALSTIAHRGAEAGASAVIDPAGTARAVETLVEGSRRVLSDARRMVRRYQTPSADAELNIAAALLAAAGVHTRVVKSPGPPIPTLPAAARAELRAGAAHILADGTVRDCVIALTRHADGIRLELWVDAELARLTGTKP